jgi:hypothetical protein
MRSWEAQYSEWCAIRDELIRNRPDQKVTAYQVSLEQRKRMLARGEQPIGYEEILRGGP